MKAQTEWCWQYPDGRLDMALFGQRGQWRPGEAGKWVRVKLVVVRPKKAKKR